MFEVEQKFRVDDLVQLEHRLTQRGARRGEPQRHVDTYYHHPCRDFAETGEAFRIRRVNGLPLITYKGKKLSGAIKARRELEWRLDPGDPDGKSTEELLELLGFRPVATVGKQRVPYTLEPSSSQIAVVVDHVGSLGVFAELERVVADKSWVEAARAEIAQLSAELGLQAVEPRSYLEMTLKSDFGAT